MRAIWSAPPPVPAGTMNSTLRVGSQAFEADGQRPATATAAAATASDRRGRLISDMFSSHPFRQFCFDLRRSWLPPVGPSSKRGCTSGTIKMGPGDRIGLLPEPNAFDQGRTIHILRPVVSETSRDQVAAWDEEAAGLDDPVKQAPRP